MARDQPIGQQRFIEAEAAYREAIARNEQSAIVHHNLGAMYAQLDRAEERQTRRLFPLFAAKLIEPTRRWTTRIRDQNVDTSESFFA